MSDAYKATLKEQLMQDGLLVSPNKRSYVRVTDITAYIDKNITETLTLDEVAKSFEISKSYLSHCFKAHTGLSVFRYIRLKRLRLAKKHYQSGLQLTESAMNAGFPDYTSFYKAYRKEFGVSPSKHRLDSNDSPD